MKTIKETLELALEALEYIRNIETDVASQAKYGRAQQIIEEVLAQELSSDEQPAQQEPVSGVVIRDGWPSLLQDRNIKPTDQRLYTSPPIEATPLAQRQARSADTGVHATTWRGLTDEEITDIWAESSPYYHEDDFARAIEAKLKEKNNG